MSTQFICTAYYHQTVTVNTNTNFKSEQGHLDNVDTVQTSTLQNLFWARCRPGFVSAWFIHLGRLWMSIIPCWSEETQKKSRASWSLGCLPRPSWLISIFTAPGLLWMLSVRDVGEHLQLRSLLVFFFIFIHSGRVCWENMSFFWWVWNSCSHKCTSELPKRL